MHQAMKGSFPIQKFQDIRTPFYYYDTRLLQRTIDSLSKEAGKYERFVVHYAIKANANPKILKPIVEAGFGADCVSGGEIQKCLVAGFSSDKIVFAGVGKSDWEINLALDANIFCFNVESIEELEVINDLAKARQKSARVCFRINPDVDAHTHANITTGLAENKFGIAMDDMERAIAIAGNMENILFIGLHFHIGSQILDMDAFSKLCDRINELQDRLESKGIHLQEINVGGGLGVDYYDPNNNDIPNFKDYFEAYHNGLKIREGQRVHFELGRAIVAQMGSLIARTLYVKHGTHKKFAILDAGMTELIRPALYQAYHKIENISNDFPHDTYDVVGPICESSDIFAKDADLDAINRGDFIAIRSAGAYGESMASQYNSHSLPTSYTLEDIDF